MLKISERWKLIFSATIAFSMPYTIMFLFDFYNIHIFFGTRSEALNILGVVIQCLSAIIAIIFSLIIVVVQSSLGKYITKIVDYVIYNWVNLFILILYGNTISITIITMWTIHQENWTPGVDTILTSSVLCIVFLIPYFLMVSPSLKPTGVMKKIQREILEAHGKGKWELVESKTNLIFSTIRNCLKNDEEEYVSQGIRLIEEAVKEYLGQYDLMFIWQVESSLNGLAKEMLEKNSNVVVRTLDAYSSIIRKARDNSTLFMNIANKIRSSILEISELSLPKKLSKDLIPKAYRLMLGIYENYILLNCYRPFAHELDENLRKMLSYLKQIDYIYIDPQTTHVFGNLLQKDKESEAFNLLRIIVNEFPSTIYPQISFGLITLTFDFKKNGFDDLATKCVEAAKKFGPIKIEVEYDQNSKTTSLSMRGSNFLIVRTGNKKEVEVANWIKQALSK